MSAPRGGDALPPLRPARVDAVLAARDRFLDALEPFATGVPAVGPRFDALAAAVAAATGAPLPAAVASCRDLMSRPLDARAAIVLAWRMAGNLPALRRGRAALPWAGQAGREWAPMEVVEAVPARDRDGGPATSYLFRVLAGTPCPLTARRSWSPQQAAFVARRLGFTARNRARPFTHPAQLVGLRLHGLVEPGPAADGPRFFHVACPPSALRHNRRLLDWRLRRVPPCPRAYIHPCHVCALGYQGRDDGLHCPAATHPETYEIRPCAGCGTDSHFDPARPSDRCLACRGGG